MSEVETRQESGPEKAAGLVERALKGLRFGSVELIVHDGRVVQVERREKVRLGAQSPGGKEAGE